MNIHNVNRNENPFKEATQLVIKNYAAKDPKFIAEISRVLQQSQLDTFSNIEEQRVWHKKFVAYDSKSQTFPNKYRGPCPQQHKYQDINRIKRTHLIETIESISHLFPSDQGIENHLLSRLTIKNHPLPLEANPGYFKENYMVSGPTERVLREDAQKIAAWLSRKIESSASQGTGLGNSELQRIYEEFQASQAETFSKIEEQQVWHKRVVAYDPKSGTFPNPYQGFSPPQSKYLEISQVQRYRCIQTIQSICQFFRRADRKKMQIALYSQLSVQQEDKPLLKIGDVKGFQTRYILEGPGEEGVETGLTNIAQWFRFIEWTRSSTEENNLMAEQPARDRQPSVNSDTSDTALFATSTIPREQSSPSPDPLDQVDCSAIQEKALANQLSNMKKRRRVQLSKEEKISSSQDDREAKQPSKAMSWWEKIMSFPRFLFSLPKQMFTRIWAFFGAKRSVVNPPASAPHPDRLDSVNVETGGDHE